MIKIKDRVEKWNAEVTFIPFIKKEACYKDNCQVTFINGGEEIIVAVRIGGISKENEITFRGKQIGDGHYNLLSDDGDIATLHKFPGDDYKILEGYLRLEWEGEEKEHRMWRIAPKGVLSEC